MDQVRLGSVVQEANFIDEQDRFKCLWEGCEVTTGFADPAQLFQHVQSHSTSNPISCEWATCTSPFSVSHVLTHMPGLTQPIVPEVVTVHPSLPSTEGLTRSTITSRPVPPPPNPHPTSTAISTPLDRHRHPTGVSFLSALVIRNLARTLKGEIALAQPSELSAKQREAKKKHLMDERFGLPIPETVLKEEEEEEEVEKDDVGMGEIERERAKLAFEAVEESIVRVIESNTSDLGLFLPDAFGF